tara:strand:- start:134 stop:325 length:192 start_codon:yes stop_codon:yes gene_type:complete
MQMTGAGISVFELAVCGLNLTLGLVSAGFIASKVVEKDVSLSLQQPLLAWLGCGFRTRSQRLI